MDKTELWFWICSTPGIYQNDIKKMMKIFVSPEEIYQEGENKILENKLLSEKQCHDLFARKGTNSFLYEFDNINKKGIKFLTLDSTSYPKRLKALADAPFALYVKGNIPKDDCPSVGIVGARACSEYGKNMTAKFTKSLVLEQCQTVSGLAVGIDSICARETLKTGGQTFAVLGSGLDVIYPAENTDLYYEIIMKGGGIISEYPMGTKPIAWQFPHRNRIISALCDVLLVFEARKKSGTLTTAQYALAQGKDVFALPGRINDKLSEGCNRLISDGAGILLSTEELLDALFPLRRKQSEKKVYSKEIRVNRECINEITGALDKKVVAVYNSLSFEPKMIDEINEITGVSIQEVSSILMELVITGLAVEIAKDYFVKTE